MNAPKFRWPALDLPARHCIGNRAVASAGVEFPFGGVKHSGHGREDGIEALRGFTTLKTVVLRHG